MYIVHQYRNLWPEQHGGVLTWSDHCGRVVEIDASRIEAVDMDDDGITLFLASGRTMEFVAVVDGEDRGSQWWADVNDHARPRLKEEQ